MIRLRLARAALLAAAIVPHAVPRAARAQAPVAQAGAVIRVPLVAGRVQPLAFDAPVRDVAVADTAVADVMVIGDRDVVLTGRRAGETDALVWIGTERRHYRLVVTSPTDRQQIVLAVKIAEVRRDALTQVGFNFLREGRTRVGSGEFNATGAPYRLPNGTAALGSESGFGTVLTDFGTRNVLALLDAEEQRGRARTLAEPTLMAGNRDSATFLAGGEIPIPTAAQQGANGQLFITVLFREFGIRLTFTPEILSDSLLKLKIRPEVSSLDYSNALILSGVRVPALRTRRLESTIDVPRDRSLIISGLIDDQRERVRTGIPGLMNIPVLGALFSSTRWQRNESELIIVVTPTIVDPLRPRPQDTLPIVPDSTLPAREALQRRLPPAPAASTTMPRVP